MTILSVQSVKRNADLIAAIAPLWIKPTDTVVDMTYGRGLFWTEYRPEHLVCHDLYTLDGVDFRHLPESDHSVDVCVFDPAYVPTGGVETSTLPDFRNRYGTDTARRARDHIQSDIRDGITEAHRVLRIGGRLLVKSMNYIEGGRFRQGYRFVLDAADAAGFEQVDEFVHHSGTGPQPLTNRDGSPRLQQHARKAHSYLAVFAKTAPRQGALVEPHETRRRTLALEPSEAYL